MRINILGTIEIAMNAILTISKLAWNSIIELFDWFYNFQSLHVQVERQTDGRGDHRGTADHSTPIVQHRPIVRSSLHRSSIVSS
jgi:hypothetical protein